MGCCNSKNADCKACRVARWQSTDIVALRDSKLKSFPDEVLDLDKSVRTLDLTHNRLVDVLMEISKLINMQRLILADNLTESLPINIGKLQSLKVMTLDANRELLPCLKNLVLLNVSSNKLKSLPESVGNCFSPEELQANENSSICKLIHLKSLCVNNNNVKQIPTNLLKERKNLQNISLHHNPISMDQFQQMEGFQDFEARRKKEFYKQIDSNAMISSKGLDEGVDL